MALLFICWLSLFQSDTYVVVYVTGNAEVVGSAGMAQRVVVGYRLKAGDQVRFLSSNTYIRLAGRGGTYHLRPGYDSRTANAAPGLLSGLVKDLLLPTPVSGEMRSRGGTISSLVDAEQAFAGYSDSLHPLLIVDQLDISVSAAFISDTANEFFYLAYRLHGDIINKRIPWEGKRNALRLRLDRRLFLVDGKDNGSEVLPGSEVFFYDTKTHQQTALGRLHVRYVSFAELQPQLCGIRKVTGDVGARPLLNYIRAYYGLMDEALFENQYLRKLNCQ